MEQQSRLKQRLVGAIVLVALAVIFIPMILNGDREGEFMVNGSSIPAKPPEIKNIRQLEFVTNNAGENSDSHSDKHRVAEEIRIPVDERSAPLSVVEKAPVPVNASNDNNHGNKVKNRKPKRSVKSTAVQKKSPSVVPTTHAWAVQVGSFKQKNNALKLRDKLRAQKYKVFVEGVRSDAQLIYRVRVGPYVSRSGAEQVRDRLQAQQKMKGLVVGHP